MRFAEVPLSVLTGILLGYGLGTVLTVFFRHFHLRDTGKVILLLGLFLILNGAENAGQIPFPCSSLIAIMSCGTAIQKGRKAVADRLAVKFNKLWIAAEILLFVLVGAAVDLAYAARSGLPVIGLIGGALLFRMIGVAVCLVKTPLNWKERGFCMLAYTPKATVQAAIGSLPLAMGLACGNAVLTVAAAAILVTAPLGAVLIDWAARWLNTEEG